MGGGDCSVCKEQGPPEARPHEGHLAPAPRSARHGSVSCCPRWASGGPGDLEP